VVDGDLRHGRRSWIRQRKCAARELHPPPQQISIRAHSQILFATNPKCALRNADGSANFRQVKRFVAICGQEILKPLDYRRMTSQSNLDLILSSETTDNCMQKLLFQGAYDLRV